MPFKKELSIIKVRLNGGLGNQLFKFFHGLKVALKYGENFVIDISWFEHNYMISNKVHNRKYELSFFKPIDKIPIYISKNQNYDSFRGRIERRLAPKIQKALGCMTEQSEYLFENPPRVIDGHFDKLDHLTIQRDCSNECNCNSSNHCLSSGECHVCLDGFKVGDTKVILKCKHYFHKDCIYKWLCYEKTNCPICRYDVRDLLD